MYKIIIQGQVQFYIEIVDEDTDGSPNDHVDDIYVDISLSPSATFSKVMSYNGDHGNGRIELSFRVQCEEPFFGQNCTTFHQPMTVTEADLEDSTTLGTTKQSDGTFLIVLTAVKFSDINHECQVLLLVSFSIYSF